MADHVKRQIKLAIKDLLNGLPTTGNRVFINRLQVLNDASLPAIVIQSGAEDIEQDDMTFEPTLNRLMRIDVVVKAKATSAIDDVLDEAQKEIETAVYSSLENSVLNGLVKSIELKTVEPIFNNEAEQDIGQLVIGFDVNYYTQASAPSVAI
jgi:hypothetical protein